VSLFSLLPLSITLTLLQHHPVQRVRRREPRQRVQGLVRITCPSLLDTLLTLRHSEDIPHVADTRTPGSYFKAAQMLDGALLASVPCLLR